MGKELCQKCERYTEKGACRMGLIDVGKCAQSEYSAFWPKPETSIEAVSALVTEEALKAVVLTSQRHGMVFIDGKFYDSINRS